MIDIEALFLVAAITAFIVFAFGDRIWARLFGTKPEPEHRVDAAAPGHRLAPQIPRRLPMPGLDATPWGGMFLECGDQQSVLIVLPMSTPQGIEWIPEALNAGPRIRAMIVLNDPGDGYLWGSTISERLGIAADSVWASDAEAPIDRHPDASDEAKRARQMPSLLRYGNLSLEPRKGGGIIACWEFPETDVHAVVGAGLSIASLANKPYANFVIGSLAPVDTKKAPSVETMLALRKFVLLADVPPDTSETMGFIWTQMGVDVAIVSRKRRGDSQDNPEPSEDAVALLFALDRDTAELRRVLEGASEADIELNLQSFVDIGQLEKAERLAAAVIERGKASGAVWFFRGLAAFMAGDTELAMHCYREAVAADPPYLEAWCNLALILANADELDEALAAADQAIAAMPDDPFSVQAGVHIRHRRGDVSGAREFLQHHQHVLDSSLRATLDAQLDNPPLPSIARFPQGAERLVAVGQSYLEEGKPELAVAPLERALALDPQNTTAASELRVALSRRARHDA